MMNDGREGLSAHENSAVSGKDRSAHVNRAVSCEDVSARVNRAVFGEDRSARENIAVIGEDVSAHENRAVSGEDVSVLVNRAVSGEDRSVRENSAVIGEDRSVRENSTVIGEDRSARENIAVIGEDRSAHVNRAVSGEDVSAHVNSTVSGEDRAVRVNRAVSGEDVSAHVNRAVSGEDVSVLVNRAVSGEDRAVRGNSAVIGEDISMHGNSPVAGENASASVNSPVADENMSAPEENKRLNARHAFTFNRPPARPLITASDTLKANHSWHIFTHKKADGDALGSANALIEAGLSSGHSVKWFSPDQTLPAGYSYLPHYSEHIHAENCSFSEPGVLYVFLDCANETRSVAGFHGDTNSLSIDHHEDNSRFARVNCVDPKASSTCELLYKLFTAGDWPVTKSIAECLYTGLFTDSGSFSFSNTSPLTHSVAAELISLGADPGHMTDLITQNKTTAGFRLWGAAMSRVRTFGEGNIFAITYLTLDDFAQTGADNTETEGLPAMLMSLMGVKMAVTLTENPNNVVRASFRSREGSPFGAGETARLCGGGGHERAAGANLDGSLDQAIHYITELLTAKYHECSRSHQ